MRERNWKSVKLSQLQPVPFNKDSFKKLVIKPNHEAVLKAMVKSYLSNDAEFNDLIKGKGRGLVILLHGSPGVGKTLTAGK